MSSSAVATDKHSTPADTILQIATGYMASACLWVALKLRIADLLGDGAKSVADLAQEADVNENALFRVLRSLSSIGVFTETSPRTFANTPASAILRQDTPGSLRDFGLWISDPFHLRNYAELMHAVKTGDNVIKKVTGLDAFDYLQKDQEEGAVFHSAMSSLSALVLPAILNNYDFSGLGTIADVAGGHGFILTGILQKHPDSARHRL